MHEWRYIFKEKRFLIIVFIALATVPSVYAVTFLNSVWNTYGRISQLPVAVVNLDHAAKQNHKTIKIGKSLAKQLVDSDSMNFTQTNAKQAKKGLDDGKYVMAITIPKNFSKNAASLSDKNPKRMRLNYETSAGHNFIASKLSESAINKLVAKVNAQVTRTYAKALYANLAKVGDGLSDGAAGATKLKTGTTKLQSGVQTITTNLNTLAAGTTTLNTGINSFNNQLSTYTNGVASASTGAQELNAGLKTMQAAVNNNKVTTLQEGLSTFQAGLNKLNSSLSQSTTDTTAITETMSTLVTDLTTLQTQQATLTKNLTTAIQAANLTDEQAAIIQKAISSSSNTTATATVKQDINTQLSTLKSELTILETTATEQQQELAAGVNKLNSAFGSKNNANTLYGGIESYITQTQTGITQLATGANTLTSGLSQLAANNSKITNGTNELATGSQKLDSGANQLATGQKQVGPALTKLSNGETTLANSLTDGAQQIADQKGTSAIYDQIAKPVLTKHTDQTKVANNGTGMAPLMMSVGLYVGLMAFNLLMDMVTPHGKYKNTFRYFIDKTTLLAAFSLASVAILAVGVHFILGLDALSTAKSVGVLLIIELMFAMIVSTLNLWLSRPGAFLSLILLVLQLSGAEGTYPIQLSNEFFATIRPYLPMTYGIHALREAMMIGGSISHDIWVMLAITAVFAVTYTAYYFTHGKQALRIYQKS
ncbi:YhgE/Pip family protein [Weissella soli]|uniref:YhgE/Pip family protein n=2 Tax=Weissella soli TaxID=155866 RepID=UPI0035A0694B